MATQIDSIVATAEEIAERQRLGLDRYDEVWEGEYVMAPMANTQHQQLVGSLTTIIKMSLGINGPAQVYPGANVSDQLTDWRRNYRCPDLVVVLPGGVAEDRGAYLYGGPDFVGEIVSPGDRSRSKFDFYAKIGTREVLIIDRAPWSLELFALQDGSFVSAGASSLPTSNWLMSAVIPFDFRIVADSPRPAIEVRYTKSGESWRV